MKCMCVCVRKDSMTKFGRAFIITTDLGVDKKYKLVSIHHVTDHARALNQYTASFSGSLTIGTHFYHMRS